jgi:hypothetical protein
MLCLYSDIVTLSALIHVYNGCDGAMSTYATISAKQMCAYIYIYINMLSEDRAMS